MKIGLFIVSCLLIPALGGHAQTSMPTAVVGAFMIVEERVTSVAPATPAPYQRAAVVMVLTDTLPPAPVRPVRLLRVRRIGVVPVWPASESVRETELDPYAPLSGYQQFWSKPGPGHFRLMIHGQPRW